MCTLRVGDAWMTSAKGYSRESSYSWEWSMASVGGVGGAHE